MIPRSWQRRRGPGDRRRAAASDQQRRPDANWLTARGIPSVSLGAGVSGATPRTSGSGCRNSAKRAASRLRLATGTETL